MFISLTPLYSPHLLSFSKNWEEAFALGILQLPKSAIQPKGKKCENLLIYCPNVKV